MQNVQENITESNINKSLVLYGIGDGGGGPGEEHIERIHREKNLYSLPRVKTNRVDNFFD